MDILMRISTALSAFGQGFTTFFQGGGAAKLFENIGGVPTLFTLVVRWLLPVLAGVIVYRCGASLLRVRTLPETWAYLGLPNGARVAVNHWENAVGRGVLSDVVLSYPSVSRSHAVLSRSDDGSWTVYDLKSKGGVKTNGVPVLSGTPVRFGDVISFADVDTTLLEVPAEEQQEIEQNRPQPGRDIRPSTTFFFLALFELLSMLQLCFALESDRIIPVVIVFLSFIVIEWAYFFTVRAFGRTGFEVELLAFWLTGIGLCVTAGAAPDTLYKQFFAVLLGMGLFIFLCWFLRDLDRAKRARWYMAMAALALFALNLAIGQNRFGARNWISIGAMTVQPSEFIKIAYIYAGASTLDRLLTTRNLYLFIGFSGACIGALFLMGDFGTAAVFFVVFLVIAFLRSGDVATVSLITAAAGFGATLILHFKPYIAHRFSVWRHVWAFADSSGYQQTRTLSAAASGGLLGVGAGNGWLKNIAAADTDLVFGVLCEEWGLLIALMAALSFALLAVFTIRSVKAGRSSFYAIASCAAVSLFLFQAALNVFGSVDMLPLTGVTLPFVSSGGSSMAASWGLLAFIKAADTRRSASFAIPLSKKKKEALS